jgi:prolyl 4-hydroxylase
MQPHPQVVHALQLLGAGRGPEAVLLINQLAAQNEPFALASLAELTWRGGLVPQDPARGRELYRRAAEQGHRIATTITTNLLATGVAGHRDWRLALGRLREEARSDPKRRAMLTLIDKMSLTDEGDPAALPAAEPLSTAPQVTRYPRLFSAAECDYLRQAAEPGYMPSTVYDSQRRLVRDPIRTSDGSTLHWLIEDPAVHVLNRRLAAASGTVFDQGEALQILRYQPGQQYRPHLDFTQTSENVRVLTALAYLNHDYDGGETTFVKTGLRIKGRKGDGIVFRNALADNRPDPLSEHAGLPVTKGTKYLASRWIRERRWIP